MQLSILILQFVVIYSLEYDGIIRDVGGGRFDAYMIPPYKSNHASFLESTIGGNLLMAWFSGSSEGANNCSIVVANLQQNSSKWSSATLVSRREGYSNQNPVLFFDRHNNVLNLFHSQQVADLSDGISSKEDTASIWHCQASDSAGNKWSEPVLLFDKKGSFDRNRIIGSLTGGLIYPVYYAVDGNENQYSAMKLSSDHINWKGYSIKDSNYLVQPSVIRPLSNISRIVAYFRDRRAEHIYISASTDEGKSWSKPEKTPLPNNNAAVQACVLSSGNIAIVYNPTTSSRNPIRIAVSSDGGKTWPVYRDLEYSHYKVTRVLDKAIAAVHVEYSYPSILQTPDEYIHVSYTFNRETIKYSKFKEEWIHQKA